jgi:hypothetical protein
MRKNKFGVLIIILFLLLNCRHQKNRIDFYSLEYVVLFDDKEWHDGSEISLLTIISVFNSYKVKASLLSEEDSLTLKITKNDSVLIGAVLSSSNLENPIEILPNDSSFICYFFHKDIGLSGQGSINDAVRDLINLLENSEMYLELRYQQKGKDFIEKAFLKPKLITTCRKYTEFLCLDQNKYYRILEQLKEIK